MSCMWKPSWALICSIVAFFDQHIAIHAPQTFFFGVVDGAPHQQPAEPMRERTKIANSAVFSSSSSFKRTSPSI
jgi:hypothetical protein